MIYIYDILVNFNSDFYEFYEWEKNDPICHIKKMPIFLVDTNFMETLLTKKIILDDPIVYEIYNKTEYFDMKKVKSLKYACLFTDSYRVIAALLDDDYKVIKVSDLLLDEAMDAIDISSRCIFRNITYNIVGTKKDYSFLTRAEIKIKKALIQEIRNAYKEKDLLKLEYLYFEYFNENCNNLDEICEKLMKNIRNYMT